MSEPTCPGCVQRDAVIAALLAARRTSWSAGQGPQARLGQNASNSSVPPSANPPGAPPPVVKKPSGRRTGGQPGHPAHRRQRLPPERVDHVIALVPAHCEGCHAPLPRQPSAGDPEPAWHQVAELPRVAAVVTEYQGHARTCPGCGHVTREPIPAEIRAHAFGPRLAAVVSYLGGCQHVSQRGLEDVVETVFGVPISLGSVADLQGQMRRGAGGAAPGGRRGGPARPRPRTSTRRAGSRRGEKRWLWAAVTATAVLFVIHTRRGAVGLQALLGRGDRRGGQLGPLECLPRDAAGASAGVLGAPAPGLPGDGRPGRRGGRGRGGVAGAHADMLFGLWHQVRDGTRTPALAAAAVGTGCGRRYKALLAQGAACGCAKTAGMCAEILKVEAALWTFASVEGVEPTNNAAERALRPAVVWRKKSFGCHSEAGCRFVERLLSVTETLAAARAAGAGIPGGGARRSSPGPARAPTSGDAVSGYENYYWTTTFLRAGSMRRIPVEICEIATRPAAAATVPPHPDTPRSSPA